MTLRSTDRRNKKSSCGGQSVTFSKGLYYEKSKYTI